MTKAKVHSPDVMGGELERERERELLTLDFGLTVVNYRVEYSLLEVKISWKQDFLPFLPFLFRGFLSWWLLTTLGLSGFDSASYGVLPGQDSDLPNIWP